jgi:hypothetical protein
VADEINQRKDDFYDNYSYLKPEREKSLKEQWDDFWDDAGQWCKEHWKLIVTVLIVIAAIVVIVFFPAAAPLLLLFAKGALLGAAIGGIAGGAISAISGGSFWEGFENGAFSGAIAGLISGGMGFALSAGGTVALSLGQTMLIGGVSGAGTSLISDVGDILIKGKDISFGQVLLNMGFSAALGAAFAGISYGISKGFQALKVKFGGKVTPIENGPYIKDGKPNGRPGPTGETKLQFEQDVYNRCVGRDGVLRDPNTRQILDWKPGQPRTGAVDFGHQAGRNYSKVFQDYANGKITLEQLKAFQFNPKNFRIEAFSANSSHLFEKSIFEIGKGIPWLSSISSVIREYIYGN